MRRTALILCVLLPALCLAQQTYHIIPQPKHISYAEGAYTLPKGWAPSKAKW